MKVLPWFSRSINVTLSQSEYHALRLAALDSLEARKVVPWTQKVLEEFLEKTK